MKLINLSSFLNDFLRIVLQDTLHEGLYYLILSYHLYDLVYGN